MMKRLVMMATAVMFAAACGSEQSATQTPEKAPEESPKKAAKTQPAVPPELSLGETYTSPANGLSITAQNPVRLDSSPLGKTKNAKTGELTPMLPSLEPGESAVVFEVVVENGGSTPTTLRADAFTFEDHNGSRLEPIRNSLFVGSSTNNLGEFLPGQERTSLVGFEVPRDATDLWLSFRPQSALVARWLVPSVVEIPTTEQAPAQAMGKA
jgi:Domain of unknown function (DUF4352)